MSNTNTNTNTTAEPHRTSIYLQPEIRALVDRERLSMSAALGAAVSFNLAVTALIARGAAARAAERK